MALIRRVQATACMLALVFSCSAQTGNNKSMKQFKERLKKYTEECNELAKSNTPATMDMFYSRADYMPGKCFVHCIMEKFELVDKSGVFLESTIRKAIAVIPSQKTKQQVEKHIDTCLQRGSAAAADDKNSRCKMAFALSDCLFQNSINKKGNQKNSDSKTQQ